MMKYLLAFLIFTFTQTEAQSQMHAQWSALLKKHVDNDGHVNYAGFQKDSIKLNEYLHWLSNHAPDFIQDPNAYKAFWINAYNAFTIKLIVDHYPVQSIKDIGGKIPFVNSSWDIKFIRIKDEKLDLNNIEHKYLLRKFSDPRIHMAIVCASKSCPILRNEAYEASQIDQQLDDQSKRFLNDPSRNKISSEAMQVSSIFKWYASDFRSKGGVRSFISKYSGVQSKPNARITYLDYDWNLNE